MSNKKVKNTNPMVHLFAQYLAGQIEEPLWKKVSFLPWNLLSRIR